MPAVQPRIVVTIDPDTREALDFLVKRYGLTQSAIVRLAVRQMAEADGLNKGKAAA
jgi:antitoxin component of RelBE/YafQ-DinJ toxin-antitoxin module